MNDEPPKPSTYSRYEFRRDLAILGMSQTEFAKIGNITRGAVYNWGNSGYPFPAFAVALIRELVEKHERENGK